MASFDITLPIILQFEGGYVDNPKDPGGETNMGITMATFRNSSQALLGLLPTSDNLKALTSDQAGVIYRHNYWDQMRGDNFQNQDLANIVCDFYVNSGTHATGLLQQVINDAGGRVACDGCIGPATLVALHALPQDDVYRRYKQGRIDYYNSLGPRYPEFLQGWLTRVDAFPDM